MSLPPSTCTLVVGAGSTVLSFIHHAFRDFVIVDAVVQGENGSRAILIHATTIISFESAYQGAFECRLCKENAPLRCVKSNPNFIYTFPA